jgi:hypothetical protein
VGPPLPAGGSGDERDLAVKFSHASSYASGEPYALMVNLVDFELGGKKLPQSLENIANYDNHDVDHIAEEEP